MVLPAGPAGISFRQPAARAAKPHSQFVAGGTDLSMQALPGSRTSLMACRQGSLASAVQHDALGTDLWRLPYQRLCASLTAIA